MTEILNQANEIAKKLSKAQNISDAAIIEAVQSFGVSIARHAIDCVKPIRRILKIYQLIAPSIINLISTVIGLGIIILPEVEAYSKECDLLQTKIKKDMSLSLAKISEEVSGKKPEETHNPKYGYDPLQEIINTAIRKNPKYVSHNKMYKKFNKKGTPREV